MLITILEISVIICALFIVIKLISNIVFILTLTGLIKLIKKGTKGSIENGEVISDKINGILDDVLTITGILNKKKFNSVRNKRKIVDIKRNYKDRINSLEIIREKNKK